MNRARILVRKAARRLELSIPGAPVRCFPVALGRNSAADKRVEGDLATPIGEFYVCAKNPKSRYLLSLCISYPNAEDARRGLTDGLISDAEHAQIVAAIRLGAIPPQRTRLGGEIYIHGQPGRAEAGRGDWTRGCVALENSAMRTVYEAADIGTPVTILE